MKLNHKKVIFMCFSFLICDLSFAASQFNLDSLLKTGNKFGHGSFTIVNNSADNLFIKSEVVKIIVENGEIKKIPLNRDNFSMWELAVNPTKVMLTPGEVKDVAIKYLCQENCDRTKDLVFQVRFTPVEIVGDSEGQSVDIKFGMAPYYIVPAEEPKVDYDYNYDSLAGIIHFKNKGNSFLKVKVDNCNSINKERNCQIVYQVLAGRNKDIILSESLKGNNTKVTVANHDQTIQKKFTL